jgi:hypothetical protein
MAKGWTRNFNTEEDWRSQRLPTAKQLEERVSLLAVISMRSKRLLTALKFVAMMSTKMDDILGCPALLTPFHCLCYANLKKYTFDHHFSFPVLPSKWGLTATRNPHSQTVEAVEKYIDDSPPDQRGFFLIQSDDTVRPLAALPEILSEPVCFSPVFTILY